MLRRNKHQPIFKNQSVILKFKHKITLSLIRLSYTFFNNPRTRKKNKQILLGRQLIHVPFPSIGPNNNPINGQKVPRHPALPPWSQVRAQNTEIPYKKKKKTPFEIEQSSDIIKNKPAS